MKAWQLTRLGGELKLVDLPTPEPRPGSVVVRMQTSAVMSYMRQYVAGELPVYHAPDRPFIPGGNGVGIVHSVGKDVWHMKPGQRVVISSHFVSSENVSNPAQILIGVTASGAAGHAMQSDWPDGTLAEYALLPASTLTPADADADFDATQLALFARFVVPFGGLLRGRLAAGETVAVSGATGAYGSAAALLAVALGASRVVAIGRNAKALHALAGYGRGRIVPVAVTGDAAQDAETIRDAARGPVDLAFDMVGNARDPNMTLAALRSLAREGRLVLMGSMAVDLPLPYTEVMLNGWEIMGQFMYPRDAFRRLLAVAGTGALEFGALRPMVFGMTELHAAIECAANASGLECVVVDHER
ncbi:zinc-binding dehydrogenase [Paraburkholderia pallida]|uniref:Zinc-binding alcohol dehydrogenase family protein n=1 Tax=Paraburkholderia pallida TaxID=2547399 RepID=A0A4P7CSJ4_9BURK|nr:zinc-binding alcohol dehydrogenase family protein [Paraburkholderia pallida]QBQ98885.1 zinc-binding alcohol dehydrogenase family protein [Paraburkholderia pallida]